MPTDESGLVDNIRKAIKKKYPLAWIFKVVGSPYQMSGVPDLLVCVNGLLVGAEVKFQRPGESLEYTRSRTTPGQRVQIARINRAGGMAGTVVSVEEALELIERGLKYRSWTGESSGREEGIPPKADYGVAF